MAWPETADPTVAGVRRAFGPIASDAPASEPARRFDGVDDRIRTAIGACTDIDDLASIVALVRVEKQPSAAATIVAIGTPVTGADGFELRYNENGELEIGGVGVAGVRSNVVSTFNDHWKLVAVTNERFWEYDFTTEEWLQKEASGLGEITPTLSPGAEGAVGFSEDLNGSQPLGFDVAAVGVWHDRIDGSSIVDMATTFKELVEWLTVETITGSAPPRGLWLFRQASVEEALQDETGNGADQTERTGTEVI